MKADLKGITGEGWACARCKEPLKPLPVDITYMGSSFPVEIPRCARCGVTFISAELALGKMLEVERMLEDK